MNFFIALLPLLFISKTKEEKIFSNEEYLNEITLKMKGPITKFGFFKNGINGYCFKGKMPSKIIINGHEYMNSINNLTAFELNINVIVIKWNKTESIFSYMFFGCEDILEADLSLLNLSYAINFDYMFANCISLTSVKLFDLNLRKSFYDINLNHMFSNCSLLRFINFSNAPFGEYLGNLNMS